MRRFVNANVSWHSIIGMSDILLIIVITALYISRKSGLKMRYRNIKYSINNSIYSTVAGSPIFLQIQTRKIIIIIQRSFIYNKFIYIPKCDFWPHVLFYNLTHHKAFDLNEFIFEKVVLNSLCILYNVEFSCFAHWVRK